MLSYQKPTKARLWLLGAIVVACLVGYYFYNYQSGDEQDPSLPGVEVAKQDLTIKITPNTDLVQRIIYQRCKDQEVFRTKPADNLIGLNHSQIQKVYSGWSIEKFDTLEVAMTLQVDSYCREHANNTFIGVKDGYVTVFYGKPGPKAIVKEQTKIPIANLMPEDLEELKRGLMVQSREDLLRTLEGLQSR